MAARLERSSSSSQDQVKEEGHSPRSSFGGERIRSSSIDGYNKFNGDTIYEYPEWNASSMGVDRDGQICILAARKGFMIIDFNNPNKPKRINCNMKLEPSALEWNPHESQKQQFASVMNQKVEIWNAHTLTSNSGPLISLTGHTRAISDLNWNHFKPELLLTCSMDTYINLWDVRESRKPASTFTTVAGSSQVKWNRINNNLFASAHDGDIRIWDTRKGNIPSVYIAGHVSKIYGLDWCPRKEENFVTASSDNYVKYWNMNAPKQYRASINNGAPVWKARYTPFGNGLTTVLVPQKRRNTIFLWNTSETKAAVHKYTGHKDVILEFQWRPIKRDDNYDDHQLVSWSKDQTLRLWRTSKKIIQAITGESYTDLNEGTLSSSPSVLDPMHFDSRIIKKNTNISPGSPPMMSSTYKDISLKKAVNTKITESGMANKTEGKKPLKKTPSEKQEITLMDLQLIDTKPTMAISPGPISPIGSTMPSLGGNRNAFRKQGKQRSFSPPPDGVVMVDKHQVLRQEFTLLSLNSPYFKIEKMDAESRLCLVTSRSTERQFKLNITFPMAYPDKTPPNFLFSKDSKIADETKEKIITAMNDVSKQHVAFSRPCLEACLRRLRYVIEGLHEPDHVGMIENYIPLNQSGNTTSYPFKRDESGDSSYNMDATVPFPRTCGARFCSVGDFLVVFSRPEKYNNIVIAERSLRSMSALNAYLQNLDTSGDNDTSMPYHQPKSIGLVYISDTSVLLPVSKDLAQSYVLTGDNPSELCHQNATLSSMVGRKDLVQTWRLLDKVLDKRLSPSPAIDGNYTLPWACHPFGRQLINSLFDYYERLKDVQTLAMMSCMLAKQHIPDVMNRFLASKPVVEDKPTKKRSRRSTNEELTPTRLSTGSPDFYTNIYSKSDVEGSSLSPPKSEEKPDPESEIRREHYENCLLLDPKDTFRYDQYKRNYAEILYRWNFQTHRTEVMKYVVDDYNSYKMMGSGEICLECNTCQNSQRKPCCINCKAIIIKCSVCRVGVRGLLSFCMACGHGGHMFHLVDWFRKKDWCPTGCGCCCLRYGQLSSQAIG